MKGNNISFRGILAIGNTKSGAINRYRLLALGKGASVFTDESQSCAFVSNSASGALTELFNPLTGDMDIVQSDDLLSSLSFQSTSTDDVSVNHYECVAGCGAHLVYDDETLVNNCPVCASVIEASDEDETEDDEEMSDDEDETSDEEMSDDEDETSDEEMSDDEDETSDEDGEETSDEEMSDDEDETSDEDGEAEPEDSVEDETAEDDSDVEDSVEDESDADEPLVIAADSLEQASKIYAKHKARSNVATASSDHDVSYVVCASESCAAHIVSDLAVSECPVCFSEVKEPSSEVLSSSISLSMSDEDESEDEDEADTKLFDDSDDSDLDSDDEDDSDEASLSGDDCDDECDDSIEDEEDETAETVSESTTVEVNFLNLVDKSVSASSLDVAYCGTLRGGSKWLALIDGQPIASISRAEANQNAEIFDTATFGNVVHSAAKHAGVIPALVDLGFKPFTKTVTVSNIVESLSADKIVAAQEIAEASKAAYAKSLMSALATAAIGLNRGFFANLQNPLRDNMLSVLASAGVRNPEMLVAQLFKDTAEPYHKVLFAKASEILEKPEDVQVELAKAILETNHQDASTSSSLDARLGNLGTVSNTEPKEVSESSQQRKADVVPIDKVVANLGRRR
jgi:hypothetical protein